jgi:hypothetical protein
MPKFKKTLMKREIKRDSTSNSDSGPDDQGLAKKIKRGSSSLNLSICIIFFSSWIQIQSKRAVSPKADRKSL